MRFLRSLYFRFAMIFLGAFALSFMILNSRFVAANVDYWFKGPLGDLEIILPSITPKEISAKPLPEQATLIIPSIRIEAPIVFNTPDNNKQIYAGLEKGAVHYSATPKPGQKGTAIILGHSSAFPWYKGNYGSVFALLGKLQPGDRFQIRYSDGQVFTFEMRQALVFNPLSDDARLVQLEQSSRPSVILLSCWPVGTDYRRLAVRAELID